MLLANHDKGSAMAAFWETHKKKILPGLILLIGIAGFALLKLTKPMVEPVEVAEKTWPVAVQKIDFIDHRPIVESFGEIRAGSEGELRTRVAGSIVEIAPGLGDGAQVIEGEQLIVIDDFDYKIRLLEREADRDEAAAHLAELERDLDIERERLPLDEQQVELAKREVSRQQKLLKSSAGRRKTYDDALSGLTERQNQLLQRQQIIARLETQIIQAASALDRRDALISSARRDLQDTRITAPFSGFLGALEVGIGQEVGASEKIADLISLDRLEVGFHVSENDFARLSSGQTLMGREIEISLRQGRRHRNFPATITRIKANVAADSAGRTVFAALSALSLDTNLRPGLFVQVHIPEKTYRSVVKLPVQAVHNDQFVYRVEDGRLRRTDVEIIDRFGDYYLISKGFKGGELVSLTRFAEMGDGIKVSLP